MLLFFFLLYSVPSKILANPVPQDLLNLDTTDTYSSFTNSELTDNLDGQYTISDAPSGVDCPSGSMTNVENVQKREIIEGLKSCPSSFKKNPSETNNGRDSKINEPSTENGHQRTETEKTTATKGQNSCQRFRAHKIYVTCGGPEIPDPKQEFGNDIVMVLNCIESRFKAELQRFCNRSPIF